MPNKSSGPSNKGEALVMAARSVSALLSASNIEELRGTDPGWTDAEERRFYEALDEIQRRLYAMGSGQAKATLDSYDEGQAQ